MTKFKMGMVKTFIQIIAIIVNVGILFQLLITTSEAFPVDRTRFPVAEERMLKPPNFPYDAPYGYRSSAILCLFTDVPYFGGWAGRSCAGPAPPFVMPTPPPTTTAAPTPSPTPTTAQSSYSSSPPSSSSSPLPYYPPMAAAGSSLSYSNYLPYQLMSHYHNNEEHNPNQFADYGDPVEGNPWEPDDDDIFIENYGYRAGRSGFRLGDPHRSTRAK